VLSLILSNWNRNNFAFYSDNHMTSSVNFTFTKREHISVDSMTTSTKLYLKTSYQQVDSTSNFIFYDATHFHYLFEFFLLQFVLNENSQNFMSPYKSSSWKHIKKINLEKSAYMKNNKCLIYNTTLFMLLISIRARFELRL
jgi:hypothetical protein